MKIWVVMCNIYFSENACSYTLVPLIKAVGHYTLSNNTKLFLTIPLIGWLTAILASPFLAYCSYQKWAAKKEIQATLLSHKKISFDPVLSQGSVRIPQIKPCEFSTYLGVVDSLLVDKNYIDSFVNLPENLREIGGVIVDKGTALFFLEHIQILREAYKTVFGENCLDRNFKNFLLPEWDMAYDRAVSDFSAIFQLFSQYVSKGDSLRVLMELSRSNSINTTIEFLDRYAEMILSCIENDSEAFMEQFNKWADHRGPKDTAIAFLQDMFPDIFGENVRSGASSTEPASSSSLSNSSDSD